MAREVIINMRGKFRNVIFYKRGDKYYGKSFPARVRQSKQTKINSGRFGKAVSVSKSLRYSLRNLLPDKKARSTMYRMNNAVYQWLLQDPDLKKKGKQPVGHLKTLSLNGDYGFFSTRHFECNVDWESEGKVVMVIPAMTPAKKIIEAPARTESVTLQIAVIGCQLENAAITENKYASIEIPFTNDELAAQEIGVPFTKVPGSLVIVAVALQYHLVNSQPLTGKNPLQWMPAGIIDAAFFG